MIMDTYSILSCGVSMYVCIYVHSVSYRVSFSSFSTLARTGKYVHATPTPSKNTHSELSLSPLPGVLWFMSWNISWTGPTISFDPGGGWVRTDGFVFSVALQTDTLCHVPKKVRDHGKAMRFHVDMGPLQGPGVRRHAGQVQWAICAAHNIYAYRGGMYGENNLYLLM